MTVNRQFKKVSGAKKYLPWKFWGDGDFIVGKFIGTSEDKYGKENFHIQLEEFDLQGLDDEAEKLIKELQLKVGDVIGLNHNGNLAYKFETVKDSDIVRITYKGMAKLPSKHKFGGKDCHQIEMEVAEDDGKGGTTTSASLDTVL